MSEENTKEKGNDQLLFANARGMGKNEKEESQ